MRYLFGNYVLDMQRYELHGAGGLIKLRRKVFQVLAYLLAHRHRVVSKQELFAHVWPDQFVGEATLTSCITTLRKALGDDGRTPRFLRTLHGQGYRFVAAVEVQEPLPVDTAPHSLTSPGERERVSGDKAATRAVLSPPFQPLPEGVLSLQEAPWPLALSLSAEHKQVTVLCGALAEAPILAARLGPEALYHLMHAVLALVQDTVQRYGGTLLQISGEGFLVLFGAPVAQEDHARRAVLAAFELRQRLHAPDALREQPHRVALCLGLHTGPVVVGPLVHDPRLPYTAVGDTLHVAIRLQQQAAADTILVSAATYRLVQDEVQGEAREARTPEIPSTSVDVYAICGLRQRWAGVPRRDARPLSRFVGRAQELALLHARLAQALGGQGQVIGIAGEPGMGKSRLLAEFARGLDGQPVTYGEGHCLAYGSAIPYLPVRDLLCQLWTLPDATPAPAVTDTIHQRLHEAGVASEAEALLLLQLLDVPMELTPLAALSPEQCKARTFALLRHLFRYASQQQPLVLAVENLHWSDLTSEEWLTSLVEQLGDMPVLLLTTYRPGYQPSWLRHSAVTQMALARLSPRDSLLMLQSIPQAAQFPAPLHQAIVAKAAGNPFFVEELTWAAGAHGDHAASLPLPDTIEAVLAARLDRLPLETKRLVQIAAVIGPEVPVPLLQTIARLSEEAVQRGLVHLQTTEFLYETRLFPNPVYTFKHGLTHEVAYGSLLQERRRVLHAGILETLEALAGDQAAEQVEVLAHHALRGEVWDKALLYCQQAKARACARSAYREAVGYLEQALEALQHLPADRTTVEQAVDVRYDLAVALEPLGQYAQALPHLREAETLAAGLADHHRLGRIYRRIAGACRMLQDYELALAYCQRAHAVATALGDVDTQMQVNHAMGMIAFDLGDYRQAMASLQQILTAVQGEQGGQSSGSVVFPAFQARVWMSRCLSELGEFADALAYGTEAIQIAEAGGRPIERLAVYSRVGPLQVRQGTLHTAIPLLEGTVVLSQNVDMPNYYHLAAPWLALAYALAGRTTDARAVLEQLGRTTDTLIRALACGEAYLLVGDVEEAHRLAQRVLTDARHNKGRGWEAWALWLLGESARHRDPPDVTSAEASYQQALALAKELGMRPIQAHCHRGLGTLYAASGRREQARIALAIAIALYGAMDMVFWLRRADAVLAQIE